VKGLNVGGPNPSGRECKRKRKRVRVQGDVTLAVVRAAVVGVGYEVSA
jgi:hypothetical protein